MPLKIAGNDHAMSGRPNQSDQSGKLRRDLFDPGRVELRQGVAGAVIARDARFEQAGVRTLIANRVHFGPNSGAGVVLAAHVEGDVRTLFDWRGALAFGAAAGIVLGLFRNRRR